MACSFDVSPDSVLVCGLPRCDALTHEQSRGTPAHVIRDRLKIAQDQRLVLWMPTYRTEGIRAAGKGPIRSFLDDLECGTIASLSARAREHGCVIVLKLHPRDPLNFREPEVEFDNVHLLKAREWQQYEIQLYDLISASDGLMSDVSSVLIDYLVTDRPIGVVGFDPTAYTRDLTFPIDALLASRRIQHLDGDDSIRRFFATVRNGSVEPVPLNDVSTFFYESTPEPAAELMLRHIGFAQSGS